MFNTSSPKSNPRQISPRNDNVILSRVVTRTKYMIITQSEFA